MTSSLTFSLHFIKKKLLTYTNTTIQTNYAPQKSLQPFTKNLEYSIHKISDLHLRVFLDLCRHIRFFAILKHESNHNYSITTQRLDHMKNNFI